jgi:AraC family transcriptional regulator, exoenzyme S synthesis regulatory protein ExsA
VIGGRKILHTAHGTYDLQQGSCVFVRKGACIVEHFFDTEFCFFLFFVTDEFICEVLKSKSAPLHKSGKKYNAVISIENNAAVYVFFKSMVPYFNATHVPDQSLLELKFRELILTLADNPLNKELLCYFNSLLQAPQAVLLQMMMEDNYCFNLSQEDFAKLCYRSLSAFKRDFQQLYGISPGKWLMEKRLNHALHLLTNSYKTVSEAAFESGFENTSHFSRTFRQRFGNSPASMKYRKIA